MKYLCAIVISILLPLGCYSQMLQQIAHPPSKEIYDLLVDKKGFLWIAHNLGISKYDGINFTSFNNAAQTAISMTDLLEDNHGRIWCHNFNGQIFYIQNEKMYYLKEYDFKKEPTYPRMVLFGDELVATYSKGLFICNTTTLKCKYLINPLATTNPYASGIVSLCIVKNIILICGIYNHWYTYTKKTGLRPLQTKGVFFKNASANLLKLQPRTCNDVAFLAVNSERLLVGLTITNDLLVTVFTKNVNANINTVSVVGNKVWINTNKNSFLLNGHDTIENYNISSLASQMNGVEWYGSLTDGLLFSSKSVHWDNIILPAALGENDYIKCLKRKNNWLVMCTEYGKVLLLNKKSIKKYDWVNNISLHSGSPEYIQWAFSSDFFIDYSKSIYLLNAATKKVVHIDSVLSIKDIVIYGNYAYLAESNHLMLKNLNDWGIHNNNKGNWQRALSNNFFYQADTFWQVRSAIKVGRCRDIVIDQTDSSLIAAFSDGLWKINDNHITPILYNNQSLYVSSMAQFDDKIYAGTFNNGLFVIENGTALKISGDEESPLDAIVKIKCCNNHIWIFRTRDIEVFDVRSDKFIKTVYPLPVYPTDITDVEEDSSNIFLASHQGLFSFPLYATMIAPKEDIFLRYILLNNRDTINNNDIKLHSNENNLLFRLSIPIYENAEQVTFKYRLNNDDGERFENNDWYFTQTSQRDIQFNALKPGNYTLTVFANINNLLVSTTPFVYHFTIQQPWYNTIWFYCSLVALCALLFWGIYQYRLRQVFKIERIRRKISNDLHDDIGSTLSSINIYSQLAKGNSSNNEYINTIQASTVEIINNLDDLVWNINPKNDILQQLLNRMQLFAMPLLSEKGIECTFKIKIEDGEILVSPDLRANIFLLFKEIVNNVVKHSNASTCNVNIIQTGKLFLLTVKDDGKGFDTKNIKTHRNGLQSMAQRAKDMKGTIDIISSPNAGAEVRLECHLK